MPIAAPWYQFYMRTFHIIPHPCIQQLMWECFCDLTITSRPSKTLSRREFVIATYVHNCVNRRTNDVDMKPFITSDINTKSLRMQEVLLWRPRRLPGHRVTLCSLYPCGAGDGHAMVYILPKMGEKYLDWPIWIHNFDPRCTVLKMRNTTKRVKIVRDNYFRCTYNSDSTIFISHEVILLWVLFSIIVPGRFFPNFNDLTMCYWESGHPGLHTTPIALYVFHMK